MPAHGTPRYRLISNWAFVQSQEGIITLCIVDTDNNYNQFSFKCADPEWKLVRSYGTQVFVLDNNELQQLPPTINGKQIPISSLPPNKIADQFDLRFCRSDFLLWQKSK